MLKRVVVNGFKSIKNMDLTLSQLNILVGANGAGKSNLVSFFKMINEMMGRRLQQYIATSGRSESLLHFGPKVTQQIEAELHFSNEDDSNTYLMRLLHAAGDTLIFADETLTFQNDGPRPNVFSLGAGHVETRILEEAEKEVETAKVVRHLLNSCRVYHFHDTSPTARVRHYNNVANGYPLMPDAANLAPFLLRLREGENRATYRRIVATVRLIAPFFDDFDLVPTNQMDVILNWRASGSDVVFGPHQFSDGTLRAICIVSLLLQPEDELPRVIVVDEPEIGLHPQALSIVAGLFGKAAHHAQILISTQSSSLLDNFEAEDVIVVKQEDGHSVFERLSREALKSWLDEYTLGEVWEKNVIGGGPH